MPLTREQTIVQSVRQYGRKLLSFIRSRVRSQSDAEDILQEVWYQLARAGDLSQVEQLGAWLFTVARRKIIDGARRKRAEPASEFTFFGEELDEPIENILFTTSEDPETQTLRKLFWEELNSALAALPPEQREIFVQNELEGLTFKQISEQSGVNLKTLISRKQYAVRKLRIHLQSLYDQLAE